MVSLNYLLAVITQSKPGRPIERDQVPNFNLVVQRVAGAQAAAQKPALKLPGCWPMSTIHPWHDIPLPDDLEPWFPVFVEISRGSKVKYELDKTTGLLRVDRILFSSVHYPANYGFVPQTWCADGDPIDVLVFGEQVAPQVLLRARAIGVMRMSDEKGRDDKIIAVHVDDPNYAEFTDVKQLARHRIRELRRFFMDYKVLEGKRVTVDKLLRNRAALRTLAKARHDYERQRDKLRSKEASMD